MKLSKEQMFDFILNNVVTIFPDGGWWIRYDDDGNCMKRFQKDYTVSINGTCMSGMDLEEAIQYYHDNYGDNNEV